ncbi:hypothetical protein [Sulfuricurvum sp.]|uniref:DUF7694 domain-containing protein n=1 Tax=Sulfuricurvum sp. TaxID=2025608 RepID=UPI00356A5B19
MTRGMRKNNNHLENFRIHDGELGSDKRFGMCGAFKIPFEGNTICIIATDGKGFIPQWEHVSVSLTNRCPNWKEMCFVKDLFWGEEEVVMQLHPAKSEYINQHPHCLHLWRPVKEHIPKPPSIFV